MTEATATRRDDNFKVLGTEAAFILAHVVTHCIADVIQKMIAPALETTELQSSLNDS